MTVTVLAMTSVRSDGDGALEEYLAVVGPLMESAGVELVNRYEVAETISGSESPQFVSVMAYPNEDAVRGVFGDPSYVAAKSVRDAAFSRYDILVLR